MDWDRSRGFRVATDAQQHYRVKGLTLLRSAPDRVGIHLLLLLLLITPLFYHFFLIDRTLERPWYFQDWNDSCAVMAAQTVAVLNDGDLYNTIWPGAAVTAIHGGVIRGLALMSPAYRRISQLSRAESKAEALGILMAAIKAGWLISLLTACCLVCVLYLVIYNLSNSRFMAFGFAFFIGSSESMLQLAAVIRAELLSLLFFWLAAFIYLRSISGKSICTAATPASLAAVGFCLSMAVFAKIQIGLAIFFFVTAMLVHAVWHGKQHPVHPSRRDVALNGMLALANIAAMPWWALQRPDFLTPMALAKLDALFLKLYGSAPESFIAPVLAVFVALVVASVALFGLQRMYRATGLLKFATPVLMSINLIISGGILASYMVCIPFSVSLSGYWDSTRNLLYSILSNVAHGGFIQDSVSSFPDRISEIIQMHALQSPMAGVNVLYPVAVALLFSLFRLASWRDGRNINYVAPVLLFLAGFSVDLIDSMRSVAPLTGILRVYSIYSVCFYGVGLALWTRLLFDEIPVAAWQRALCNTLRTLIVIGVALNFVGTGYRLWNTPPSNLVSSVSPAHVNSITHYLAPSFWRIATQNR